MSTSINFAVVEPFPLPIRAEADGGMFQADKNGMMFLLQLSRTDAIAVEAFRTGEIELALTEVDGILFFLYRIDGIFKDGWGDAPLSFGGLSNEHLPSEESLARASLHLCLVDARLSLLLAQREAQMPAPFADFLRRHTLSALEAPLAPQDFAVRVQSIWQRMSPAEMREEAAVVWEIPLALKGAPLH